MASLNLSGLPKALKLCDKGCVMGQSVFLGSVPRRPSLAHPSLYLLEEV